MNGPVGALELGGTHVTVARVEDGRVVPGSRARLALRPDGDRAELLRAILQAAVAAHRWAMVRAANPSSRARKV